MATVGVKGLTTTIAYNERSVQQGRELTRTALWS